MPLFTFVLEFDGGTYLSQVTAPSSRAAPAIWARAHIPNPLPGFGPASNKKLAQELSESEPVAIAGLHATWCISATVRGKLALVHFVQTDTV